MPANARFNVPVLTTEVADGPDPHARAARHAVQRRGREPRAAPPIVVERAMYWNADGQLWAAGSDLLATKLQ